MTAPVSTYVQLPSDSANTGKKNRTQTKTVGANSVHEHFVVQSPNHTRNGRFVFQSTGELVQASSHTGTGTGFYWIQNSTGNSNVVAVIREISVGWSQSGAAVASQTAPLLLFSKFTFNTAFTTGTADITPLSYTTASNTIKVNTTSSGATVTLGRPFAALPIPAIVTTVGTYGGYETLFKAADDYSLDTGLQLTTGQGLIIYQDQAGTASDTRKTAVRVVWDEVDVS